MNNSKNQINSSSQEKELNKITWRFNQPKIDAHKLWENYRLIFKFNQISEEFIETKIKNMRAALSTRFDLAVFLNGPCLPIILPPVSLEKIDWPIAILSEWLAIARQQYKLFYHQEAIFDYEELDYEIRNGLFDLKLIDQSRQAQLLTRLFKGPTIVLYFPMAFVGWSQEKVLARFRQFPNNFILAGLEAILAIAYYPQTFGRQHYLPHIRLDGLIDSNNNQPIIIEFSYNYALINRQENFINIERIASGLSFFI